MSVPHYGAGFAEWNIHGTFGEIYAPLELGPDGGSIFGPTDLPAVCLRGGVPAFAGVPAFWDNHGGNTSFYVPPGFDPLLTAPDDPFSLWP